MTEIEIGLGAVVGDEDLAVLERRHRSGIHVEVWIELHNRDAHSALDEQSTQRGRGDSFAER